MAITYILIFILLFHIYLFRELIFNWNVYGVFFISNLIFSIIGILLFPLIKNYTYEVFWTFKLKLISDAVIIETQVLAVLAILITLYSYVFIMQMKYKKVKCINHFKIDGGIKNNISQSNYYFLLLLMSLFLIVYLFIKRNTLYIGFFDGLIDRNPEALLTSRRSITSNYIYVIITYNLLPFITIVSLYLKIYKKSIFNKFVFYILFITSTLLILLLFQKRPLILFLLTFIISSFIFRKDSNRFKLKKPKTKKQIRRRIILYGGLLFSLLMILYYSSTNYKFNNILEGAIKLTEVSMTRVIGRLSIPSFLNVHYFPEVEEHYGIRNIGMLSKIFRFEMYEGNKKMFTYFSVHNKDGNLAIGSIMDFYGGFGYYGILFGSILIGGFLGVLDSMLDKLKKNATNVVFIIFCFVFGYYLSQASFARSIMGYGFFFFIMTWIWLQKGFKIKLR